MEWVILLGIVVLSVFLWPQYQKQTKVKNNKAALIRQLDEEQGLAYDYYVKDMTKLIREVYPKSIKQEKKVQRLWEKSPETAKHPIKIAYHPETWQKALKERKEELEKVKEVRNKFTRAFLRHQYDNEDLLLQLCQDWVGYITLRANRLGYQGFDHMIAKNQTELDTQNIHLEEIERRIDKLLV
jgi:hypothetical protein